MKVDEADYDKIIKKYKKGASLNALAREYKTYPITISRILEKKGIKLRHDKLVRGSVVNDRSSEILDIVTSVDYPLTEGEIAAQMGIKRLPPKYLKRCPEIGKYIAPRAQADLRRFYKILTRWLDNYGFDYKLNDRKALGVSIDVLLLGKYNKVGILINIRPRYVSKKLYDSRMQEKLRRAKLNGIPMILLEYNDFPELSGLREEIDRAKDLIGGTKE